VRYPHGFAPLFEMDGEPSCLPNGCARSSDFGILSDLGSRISGFATSLLYPLETSKNPF
jgi:hypothetical protein